jgi:hypothetical protein
MRGLKQGNRTIWEIYDRNTQREFLYYEGCILYIVCVWLCRQKRWKLFSQNFTNKTATKVFSFLFCSSLIYQSINFRMYLHLPKTMFLHIVCLFKPNTLNKNKKISIHQFRLKFWRFYKMQQKINTWVLLLVFLYHTKAQIRKSV